MILTIGRQFGAGGREIGKAISEKLGIAYYDKELLTEEAKISGLCKEYLEKWEEKNTGSLLYSFVMGTRKISGQPSLEEIVRKAQCEAVESVADMGDCVIIGRCADYILRQRKDILRIFLSADEVVRINRISRREKISLEEAASKMKKMDKVKAAYYSMQTGQQWGNSINYDLCLYVSSFSQEYVLDTILRGISR